LLLAKSEVTGQPVRLCCNRQYLARDLALGFVEFQLVNADAPVLCQDERRSFVWVVLNKEEAIAPTSAALRHISAEGNPTTATAARAKKLKGSHSSSNGQSSSGAPTPRKSAPQSQGKTAATKPLIEEAQTLRTILRDALARSNSLIRSIQRHRKQARMVATTLASLRQLQRVDA